MSFIEFISNLKIHPYKYIEPCPKCGSYITGRYMKEPITESDMEYIERESLKHGEIVRFAPREPDLNAFCVDCGHKWRYMPRTIFLSKAEMEAEIEKRGTAQAYTEFKQEISDKDSVSGNRKKGFL